MITLEGLAKTYADGTEALRPTDLELGEGVTGLLGPNGAGKTTLLAMLTLALEPSRGRRTYFGLDDRVAHRPRIRARIGYLPQEYSPVPNLTGLEYLVTCGELRRVPLGRRGLHDRALRLLEAVELADAAHRRSGTYSGGMKRRLGLAQALLHGPRLLVVDEPTAGLDPEERIRFRTIVTDIGDRIPVLLSTHIVEDIEATCPRVAVLAEGSLRFDGDPGELLRRAAGRLWALPLDGETDAPVLAQRSSTDAEAQQVVLAERPPTPGATPVEPTLEEAYAAFLAALDRREEGAAA